MKRPPVATEEHLLPASATDFERALSLGDAVAYGTRAFDPDMARRARHYALCPLHLLPYLAWERSLHEWDPAWPEWRKRNAVADSFDLHKRYGTRWALERALAELGVGAEVDEWFEYRGRPYCFRVRIPVPDGWSTKLTRTVYRVAIGAKNARSYLDELRLVVTPDPPPGTPPGTPGTPPWQPGTGRSTAPVAVAAVAVQRRRIVATTGALHFFPLPPAPALVGAVAVQRRRLYAVISEARTAIAFPRAGARVGAAAVQRRTLYART